MRHPSTASRVTACHRCSLEESTITSWLETSTYHWMVVQLCLELSGHCWAEIQLCTPARVVWRAGALISTTEQSWMPTALGTAAIYPQLWPLLYGHPAVLPC
ncbi:hypothetical protein SRHO_G00343090 [Serrasalmus rhombeus]